MKPKKMIDTLFARYMVRIIDLYEFTEKLDGGKYIEHVHYNEEVRKLQATFIAGSLLIIRI